MGKGKKKKQRNEGIQAKLTKTDKKKARRRRRKLLRFIVGSVSVSVCFAAVRFKVWDKDNNWVWEQIEQIKSSANYNVFPQVEVKKDPIDEADKFWKDLKGVEFVNQGFVPVELWYWTPHPRAADIKQGEIPVGGKLSLNSKRGELFYFSEIGKGNDRLNALWEKMLESNKTVVLYSKFHKKRNQTRFDQKYLKRTGRKWVNFWPREPVMYHYHNVTKGESIEMITDRTQFHLCSRFEGELSHREINALEAMEFYEWDPKKAMRPPSFQTENDGFYIGRMNGTNYCRRKVDRSDPEQVLSWKITNICDKGPNAFRIFNFLSDDEMDHIKNLGQTIGMERSMVTGFKLSSDRTSQTVWIARDQSFIVDNVIRRIADMVQIPHQRMFLNASAESLQLVHYSGGEFYKPHFDFTTEKPHSRYVTFLMYLNEVNEGGYTSFPKADESCTNEEGYFGIPPIKGSVAFFYSLFPDGSGDSKTQHQGEPPVNGEKWMTNLWIWDKIYGDPDPMRKGSIM